MLGRADLVHRPFQLSTEAADHGVPNIWAPGTSVSEILRDDAATIVPWDAAAAADHVLTLIADRSMRQRNLAAVRTAAAGLSWDATARALLEVYRQTCDGPPASGRAVEPTGDAPAPSLSEDALRLVGPRGAVPSDLELPPLSLATHRTFGRSVFGLTSVGDRASGGGRRIAERIGSRDA